MKLRFAETIAITCIVLSHLPVNAQVKTLKQDKLKTKRGRTSILYWHVRVIDASNSIDDSGGHLPVFTVCKQGKPSCKNVSVAVDTSIWDGTAVEGGWHKKGDVSVFDEMVFVAAVPGHYYLKRPAFISRPFVSMVKERQGFVVGVSTQSGF